MVRAFLEEYCVRENLDTLAKIQSTLSPLPCTTMVRTPQLPLPKQYKTMTLNGVPCDATIYGWGISTKGRSFWKLCDAIESLQGEYRIEEVLSLGKF